MLEVGRIIKPHGLRGDVIVELFTNREERLLVGTPLSTPTGSLVVERASRHQHRWIVTFRGVNGRGRAEALRGTVLSADPIDDPSVLWVHELIGSQISDATGAGVGVVAAVIANPAGDLIETEAGALIPLRFVVGHGPGTVSVDMPEGLLDL